MTSWLKDDLTVALDDVDRTASRVITIYEDLAAIAADPAAAQRLRERGERHRQALVVFNEARTAAGQIPEVADPERAHLQSLWLALKSSVAGEHSEERLQQSLVELDEELLDVIRTAQRHHPDAAVERALDALSEEVGRPT